MVQNGRALEGEDGCWVSMKLEEGVCSYISLLAHGALVYLWISLVTYHMKHTAVLGPMVYAAAYCPLSFKPELEELGFDGEFSSNVNNLRTDYRTTCPTRFQDPLHRNP